MSRREEFLRGLQMAGGSIDGDLEPLTSECRPLRIVRGPAACIGMQCARHGGDDHCDQVREEIVCGTHSGLETNGEITHIETWPCKHSMVVTA